MNNNNFCGGSQELLSDGFNNDERHNQYRVWSNTAIAECLRTGFADMPKKERDAIYAEWLHQGRP